MLNEHDPYFKEIETIRHASSSLISPIKDLSPLWPAFERNDTLRTITSLASEE
jgi:hypothetical protein